MLGISQVTVRHLFWKAPYFSRLPPRVVWMIYEIRNRLLSEYADVNPLALRWTDPHDIDHYHEESLKVYGHVRAGDWDTPDCKFSETTHYRSMKMRFDEGAAWQETPLYEEYATRIDDGDPYWRCQTPEQLQSYFSGIDDLYGSIRRHGYRSQRSLYNENPHRARQQTTDAPHPLLEEICVNVHRDGTLAKSGAGNHRLAIAQLLDIDEVPFIVRVRHANWQAVRDEISVAATIDELDADTRQYVDHPDLEDVVPAK